MASVMCATKCPHCGRSAIIDDFYKIAVRYIHCRRCGYNCVQCPDPSVVQWYGHEPEENFGYGVFFLYKQNGHTEMVLFNGPQGDMEQYEKRIMEEDPELKHSYLVRYEDGLFTILLGNPSENFHLPFEEYAEKVIAEYGGIEETEGLVPIED